jgi:hypothetical protein
MTRFHEGQQVVALNVCGAVAWQMATVISLENFYGEMRPVVEFEDGTRTMIHNTSHIRAVAERFDPLKCYEASLVEDQP